MSKVAFNPELDLQLVKTLNLTTEEVWRAYTTPELLKEWFCPKPWGVSFCEIDLQPGGVFKTIMRSPEGEEFPNIGCFLVTEANTHLIWTDCMLPGFRPALLPESSAGFLFTASISLSAHEGSTVLTAVVKHKDRADKEKHEAMGFYEGWSISLNQLEALMLSQKKN